MSSDEANVSTSEFAAALEKSVRTVKFWCQRGWVRCIQTPGGHYRIVRSEIERVRAGRPLPSDTVAA